MYVVGFVKTSSPLDPFEGSRGIKSKYKPSSSPVLPRASISVSPHKNNANPCAGGIYF